MCRTSRLMVGYPSFCNCLLATARKGYPQAIMSDVTIDWQAELSHAKKKPRNWAKFSTIGDSYRGVVVRYQPGHGAFTLRDKKKVNKGVLIIDPISTPTDPEPHKPEEDPKKYIVVALDKQALEREVRDADPVPGLQISITYIDDYPVKNMPYPAKIFDVKVGDRPEVEFWTGCDEDYE